VGDGVYESAPANWHMAGRQAIKGDGMPRNGCEHIDATITITQAVRYECDECVKISRRDRGGAEGRRAAEPQPKSPPR
jgi:hypothetical protein